MERAVGILVIFLASGFVGFLTVRFFRGRR
jgi:hypothetical protein